VWSKNVTVCGLHTRALTHARTHTHTHTYTNLQLTRMTDHSPNLWLHGVCRLNKFNQNRLLPFPRGFGGPLEFILMIVMHITAYAFLLMHMVPINCPNVIKIVCRISSKIPDFAFGFPYGGASILGANVFILASISLCWTISEITWTCIKCVWPFRH
jgi:hypothetical protein